MKLKEKTVGMFIGKFLPPHMGHISTILACAKSCDEFFVVVADSPSRSRKICSEAGIKYISPSLRFSWMKEIFKEEKNIEVVRLGEGMLEALPDGLECWKSKLDSVTKHKKPIWFIDKNYLDISHKVFPEMEFVGFDRSIINISATEIRNSIKTHADFLPEVVLDYFKNSYKL